MYRRINPTSAPELPLRMLYQPAGEGSFHRACEADSFRGLVAAILDDPAYETAGVEGRLMARLRLADDVQLLTELDGRRLHVADRDGDDSASSLMAPTFLLGAPGLCHAKHHQSNRARVLDRCSRS